MTSKKQQKLSYVYLLHFSSNVANHAQHYYGWASNGAEDRLREHLAGKGTRLNPCLDATDFQDKFLEAQLKNPCEELKNAIKDQEQE